MRSRTYNRIYGILTVLAVFLLSALLFFFLEAVLVKDYHYLLNVVGIGGVFRYHSVSMFGVSVSLYWLMHVIGVFLMIWICLIRAKQYKVSSTEAIITALYLAVSGYIGAKLLYTVENLQRVLQNGIGIGGVSFFGTVFFVPLAVYVYTKIRHKEPAVFLDYCTPSGLIMLAMIRTGCFMNNCCGSRAYMINGNTVYFPIQLLEAVLDIILLIFILKTEEAKVHSGYRYALFMGGYGIIRMITEMVRKPTSQLAGMTNGQLFAIVSVIICFLWINRETVKNKTNQ